VKRVISGRLQIHAQGQGSLYTSHRLRRGRRSGAEETLWGGRRYDNLGRRRPADDRMYVRIWSPLCPRWQFRTGRLDGCGWRRRRWWWCGSGCCCLALSPCAGLGAFVDWAPASADWAFWCWGLVDGHNGDQIRTYILSYAGRRLPRLSYQRPLQGVSLAPERLHRRERYDMQNEPCVFEIRASRFYLT